LTTGGGFEPEERAAAAAASTWYLISTVMTLQATWWTGGTHAQLRDEENDLWARVELVDDWYPEGSRKPEPAWTVEWLCGSGEEARMVRDRLDIAPNAAQDRDAMVRVSEAAAQLARGSAPGEPPPFGHAGTGITRAAEAHKRVELISHAVQAASGRLHEAALSDHEWAGDLVLVALTEAVAWVRALDDAMNHLWRARPKPYFGDITKKIDSVLQRRGWDPKFVSWARSRRDAAGYDDWTIGLLIRGIGVPRDELLGIRWLAGKLLHFGPLPAVELKQWRAGEPPRWKWRPAADIFSTTRGERRSDGRSAYDDALAGRDLIGTFNLFDPLHAAELLAWELSGRPEA
jgi:hypothetical protein